MTEDLLIIFARRLQPGQVKTRLIGAYGAEGALAIYRQLLARTCAVAAEFPGQVWLCVDQHDPQLAAQARESGWRYGVQQGDDLGQRMANAVSEALQCHRRVLLIGSDCVVMGADYLGLALAALADKPVVFGASSDGGYVLLGGSQRQHWQPERFNGVRFGGPQALADSLACFPSEQVSVLPALWDVDEPADVQRAVAEGLLMVDRG